MSFITDAELLQAVSGALSQDEADLVSKWSDIVHDQNAAAYHRIIASLLGRGYTLAQILTWSRGGEYQRAIGLYWSLVHGGGLTSADPTFIDRWARYLDDLEGVLLTDGEEVIDPGTVSQGKVSYGKMNTDNMTFKRDTKW